MFDTGIGQHPFEVMLTGHEDRCSCHGEQPQPEQSLLEKDCFIERGLTDLIDPCNGQKSAGNQPAGQQRPHQTGGLAVGIRFPGVQRCQPQLGAVPYQQEDKGGMQPAPVQHPGIFQQFRQQQCGILMGNMGGVGQKQQSE